jgi:hypothetical protein
MTTSGSYTLILTDGSYYIDETAAGRVREALRLDVDQFLILTKVCGTTEPDRLVSIKSDSILTLVAHDEMRRRKYVRRVDTRPRKSVARA